MSKNTQFFGIDIGKGVFDVLTSLGSNLHKEATSNADSHVFEAEPLTMERPKVYRIISRIAVSLSRFVPILTNICVVAHGASKST